MFVRYLQAKVALGAVIAIFGFAILWLIMTFIIGTIAEWTTLSRIFYVLCCIVMSIVSCAISDGVVDEIRREDDAIEADRKAIWTSDCDCGTCDDCNLQYELAQRRLTAMKVVDNKKE